MNNYVIQKQLGRGSHGRVWLATCKRTGEKVAIKVVSEKFSSLESCERLGEYMIYRDVFHARSIAHPNVVRVRDAILSSDSELHFVIDYMPENLRRVIQHRGAAFSDGEARMVTRQILEGLKFINAQGFFHRDIKPENILCDGLESVKIGDFGEARKIDCCYPYTANIATRWYRAPKLLLCADHYSWPVDIWALGCIMAELFTLKPLFPGRTELEQISLISTFLGTPSRRDWDDGWRLVHAKNLTWQACQGQDIRAKFPGASRESLDVLKKMLAWSPASRPTARQALSHAAFQSPSPPPLPPPPPPPPTTPAAALHYHLEQDRPRSMGVLLSSDRRPKTTGMTMTSLSVDHFPLPQQDASPCCPLFLPQDRGALPAILRDVRTPPWVPSEIRRDVGLLQPRVLTADIGEAWQRRGAKASKTGLDKSPERTVALGEDPGGLHNREDLHHHQQRESEAGKDLQEAGVEATSKGIDELEAYITMLRAKVKENCEAMPDFYPEDSGMPSFRCVPKSVQKAKKKSKKELWATERRKD